MSFSLAEKYKMALEVYAFINENQMCSRSDLNSEFKAVSNEGNIQKLSDVLNSLLVTERIKKHRDVDSNAVFFWTSDFRNTPYPPDTVTPTGDEVVDIFGRPPALDEPAPTPALLSPVEPTALLSAKERHWLDMRNHVKGILRILYDVLLKDPKKVFGVNDSAFVEVSPDYQVRCRFLGRLWSMNVGVRKAISDKANFYTLDGVFSADMQEQELDKIGAAQKKREEKLAQREKRDASMESLRVSVNKQTSEEEIKVEDEDQEIEEDALPRVEGVAENDDKVGPCVYVSNEFDFQLVRSDGSSVVFDEEENDAMREMILNLNLQRLEKFQEQE